MCGVMGMLSPPLEDVYDDLTHGLFQMQHRGQDACGVAISDGDLLRLHRGLGYVREAFAQRPYDAFRGWLACGHVRYPTQGSNRLQNAQPHMTASFPNRQMALASNGDLTNYWAIRSELETHGVRFAGTNDAELLLNFITYEHVCHGRTLEEAIALLMEQLYGAYSAVLITRTAMYAFRDPHGIRPLCFGGGGGAWVVASETSALDILRVDLVAELEPGELIRFEQGGMRRIPHRDVIAARFGREKPAHCVFEYVYFSRPDAICYGQRVYDVRKRIGAWLGRHDAAEGDVVVPVPDSSNSVALGYALETGLPFEFGLIRNHYVGRTFIDPDQPRRDDSVRMKFNPLRSVFKDRRVILVDDSIVRGTTSRKLVRMIRSAGAKEVHLRIGSPVTRFSCFYGIDTPTAEELIGNQLSVDQIRSYLTADSLMYMPVSGLRECVGDQGQFCMACFDGDYPIKITEQKVSRERREEAAEADKAITRPGPFGSEG
jgi:amidophosphoribosyltransferase